MRASRRLLACIAALAATAAQALELGTLFTTPAERERLDRLRRGEPVATDQAPGGSEHAITGYVKRSDGRGTVWIDGYPVLLRDRKAERLLDPDAVRAYSRSAGDVRVERDRPR